jgi:TP901 family phage tail tape measure protein
MGKAQASIEITASSNRLAAGLNAARVKFQGFASSVARGMGSAFKSLNKALEPGQTLKNAGSHMLGDLGSRGLGAILEAGDNVRTFERNLVRYQIASSGSAASTASLRKEIREVSRATGVADAEILNGAQTYVALTGDANGAKDAMTAFARVAQASGSSVSDVAQATAALKQSMAIDGSQVEAAFSGLITQGKAGAVEIKDFAGELATLSPQFATFGKTGLAGLRDMGAAFQVIRQGAGTAGEAATQFQAVMGELVSSHKELKKIGIDVFHKNPKTGKRELRDFMSIAEDLAKNKALGDPAKMAKIFGRKESQAAIRTIREQIGAMRDLARAGEDTGAVQRDLGTFLESDAGRMEKAFNSVKIAIAEAFTPERIKAFTSAVEGVAEKVGPLVESLGWVVDKYNSLHNVGKSIRGISGSNGNPFKRQTTSIGGGVANQLLDAQMSPAERAERDRNAAGYDSAVSNILAGETNERTSPESIKRAVVARFSSNAGTVTASSRYLANAHGSGSEVAATVEKVVREEFAHMGGEFAKGLRGALGGLGNVLPDVRIGDNAVAAASANATKPRRGAR